MTSRDFCYWLQGFFELSDNHGISPEKSKMIQTHLAMVFHHEIDPSMGDAKKQDALNVLHNIKLYDLKPNENGPFAKSTIGGEIDTPAGPIRYRC